MKQVKNIKITFIITTALILLWWVLIYLYKDIYTDYCIDFMHKIPLEKCISMKYESWFIWFIFTLWTIGIFILFIKVVSYLIIKATNKINNN